MFSSLKSIDFPCSLDLSKLMDNIHTHTVIPHTEQVASGDSDRRPI